MTVPEMRLFAYAAERRGWTRQRIGEELGILALDRVRPLVREGRRIVEARERRKRRCLMTERQVAALAAIRDQL